MPSQAMKTAVKLSEALSLASPIELANVSESCVNNPQLSPLRTRRRLWWSRMRPLKPSLMSLGSTSALALQVAGHGTLQAMQQAERRGIAPASGVQCQAATQRCG